MLTGVKDIDIIILNKLEDKDLVNICKVNKLADQICKDQTFWLNRILIKFPYLSLEILNKYKKDRSWSQYYINDLRNTTKNHFLLASEELRLDWIIIALNDGADIHSYKDYALRIAARRGDIDIVRYLTEAGANIHAVNDEPLRDASANGYINVVKYLVEAGANIHAHNDEAIRFASRNGKLDIVRYLAEAGADMTHAVRMAYTKGHSDIVKYLIEMGAPDHN